VTDALRRHWPEYLMEAAGLGLFMISACAFATLLQHPASPVRQSLGDPFVRRMLMGAAMGSTAVGIIYSPWGQRSGAHINPSVTLTFWTLGKVAAPDALFYMMAQLAGAVGGMAVAITLFGAALADPNIMHVATRPGPGGAGPAFAAEAAISFLLMMVVLATSNVMKLARYTGMFAGLCVALFITFEDPFSGMSMNPARTFGSAWAAGDYSNLWIYLAAPTLGMLAAAALFSTLRRVAPVRCAKLNHVNDKRCIFRCGFMAAESPAPVEAPGTGELGQAPAR